MLILGRKISWKALLKNLVAVLLLCLASTPLFIHIIAMLNLPKFHYFVRAYLDNIWRYHIADSSVTVGLAYYCIMLFMLWKSRWLGWNGFWKLADILMEAFQDFPYSLLKRPDDAQPEAGEMLQSNLVEESL